MYELLLNERAVRVHLYSIKMSLSQSQAGEGQEGTDVSADSGQTELHCELRHWDSTSWGERNIILQIIFNTESCTVLLQSIISE